MSLELVGRGNGHKKRHGGEDEKYQVVLHDCTTFAVFLNIYFAAAVERVRIV